MARQSKSSQTKKTEDEVQKVEEVKPTTQIKARSVTRDTAAPKVGKPKAAHKPVVSPGFGTTKVYSISPTS
jgi:hypothetical protein